MEGFYDRASAVSMFLSGSVAVNNVAPIVRSPTVEQALLDILTCIFISSPPFSGLKRRSLEEPTRGILEAFFSVEHLFCSLKTALPVQVSPQSARGVAKVEATG